MCHDCSGSMRLFATQVNEVIKEAEELELKSCCPSRIHDNLKQDSWTEIERHLLLDPNSKLTSALATSFYYMPPSVEFLKIFESDEEGIYRHALLKTGERVPEFRILLDRITESGDATQTILDARQESEANEKIRLIAQQIKLPDDTE